MAITHSATLRNDFASDVLTRMDAGTTNPSARFILKEGATVLATIALDNPCGAVSGEVLTFSGFPKTVAASASGTPDSFDITDRDNNVIWSGSAGTSGTDAILSSSTTTSGLNITINSPFSYTAAA